MFWMKVHRVKLRVHQGQMTHQMNPVALSMEPLCTFIWTPEAPCPAHRGPLPCSLPLVQDSWQTKIRRELVMRWTLADRWTHLPVCATAPATSGEERRRWRTSHGFLLPAGCGKEGCWEFCCKYTEQNCVSYFLIIQWTNRDHLAVVAMTGCQKVVAARRSMLIHWMQRK